MRASKKTAQCHAGNRHARAFPWLFQNHAGNQLGGCCCRKAVDGGCGSSFLRTRSAKLQLVATSKAAIDWFRLLFSSLQSREPDVGAAHYKAARESGGER